MRSSLILPNAMLYILKNILELQGKQKRARLRNYNNEIMQCLHDYAMLKELQKLPEYRQQFTLDHLRQIENINVQIKNDASTALDKIKSGGKK